MRLQQRCLLCSAILTLAAFGPAHRGMADDKPVLELAKEFEFFQPREFAWHREVSRLPQEQWRRHNNAMAKLHALRVPVAELLTLLRHEDPKVRTIALAGLLNHDDPALLEHKLPLFQDTAKTFPHFQVLRSELFIPGVERKIEILPQDVTPQSVGDVARALAAHWMEAAGFDREVTRKMLEEYLAAQKKAGFRTSWFLARMNRITSVSTAIHDRPESKKAEFDALKKMIDAQPPQRRDWLLLYTYTSSEYGIKAWRIHLGSEAVPLGAAKRLGPDFLMKIVSNELIPGDADLVNDARSSNLRWSARDFVLTHAGDLLKQEHAAVLLKIFEKDTRFQSYLLGASALERKNARNLLTKAMLAEMRKADFFTEPNYSSSRLAAGYVRFVDDDGVSDAVGWYYNRKVPETFQFSDSRDVFLHELEKHPAPRTVATLKRIILDERFAAKVGNHSLFSLGLTVNHHSKQRIADGNDLHYAHHDNDQGGSARAALRAALIKWARAK